MNNWLFEYHSYIPKEQKLREVLCALGNGYFVSRGAFEESEAGESDYPGTYLAGGYNRLKTEIEGHVIENEDLVNLPNWLPLKFRICGGSWFNLQEVEVLFFNQSLNIKDGVLTRKIRFKDNADRETSVTFSRFVSMDHPHLAAIRMNLNPENWEGEIEIQSALDGRIQNRGVERYAQLNAAHLEPLETAELDGGEIYLQVRTNQSHIHVALAARTQILLDGRQLKDCSAKLLQEQGLIAKFYAFQVSRGQNIEVEKIVSFYSSKDNAISECGLEAKECVSLAGTYSYLIEKHRVAWKLLWKRFDIQLDCSEAGEEVSLLLRLHIFHMLQTTSPHSCDLDIGVPPRGWHGEAYRGHILWDELFVFSTLNLQLPELTRALLLYRYRRLPKARLAAREAGLKGAMYPWQSGSDGREESQKTHLNPLSKRWIPDNSSLQRHINGAIAYNVWQHFEATNDIEFLSFYGAEMILETARFFTSLASYNAEKKRYEILGVMGPDEYHDGYPDSEKPGVHNNAYTNVLVSWLLTRSVQTLSLLPQDRKEELEDFMGLTSSEIANWEEISRNLYIPFHSDGVISQFEGYEKLAELDFEQLKRKWGNIHRLDRILEAEGDDINRYKASKQADVLMLFFLFSAEELREVFERMGYKLEPETIQKTIDYYSKRTSHGSTLSRLVHSWVLARSDRKMSWEFFHQLLRSDVEDIQGGTTQEGIHLGAMAGTVDLIQRCYTGLEYRGETLRFNPSLPDELRELRTVIRYRGHSLSFTVTQDKLIVESKRHAATPIRIACRDEECFLKEGEFKEFFLIELCQNTPDAVGVVREVAVEDGDASGRGTPNN
ncbi:MAG: glycoside hydrolase family 65 protein [Chlamydiales bacterium]|nr:glycoside hydrolase family 65 protein [Chlamydiales bacterium]